MCSDIIVIALSSRNNILSWGETECHMTYLSHDQLYESSYLHYVVFMSPRYQLYIFLTYDTFFSVINYLFPFYICPEMLRDCGQHNNQEVSVEQSSTPGCLHIEPTETTGFLRTVR